VRRAQKGGQVATDDTSTELLAVLVRLRETLVGTGLPLDVADVETARRTRRDLFAHL
jgi:hypothetical protein